MSTWARLAAFAAVLVVAFASAVGAGKAIDPDTGGREDSHAKEKQMAEMTEMKTGHGAHSAEAAGLAVAEKGLRLVAAETTLQAHRSTRYDFRIAREDGSTVRDFDVEHSRRMHMIVVRRDLTGYEHVHPRQRADGSWTVNLRLNDPGVYRVYADFGTRGASHTLATDVFVPGRFSPEPLPAAAESATGDGYNVALERHGDELFFRVTRDGRPVDVQPYLGADGHLVALRQGDLAFLHVHPSDDHATAKGAIAFHAEYPSKGSYRLFLQFKHRDSVHTVAFTQEVR
ncbi:MAG TPA: hypothetical protein VF752_10595 [Thermoleophilaceae bacterium]